MTRAQATYCFDATLTPRARTIFRSKTPAPPPPPAHPPARGGRSEPKELGWHDLTCALLESLFPFPDAYTVALRALDEFGTRLPRHPDYPRPLPVHS